MNTAVPPKRIRFAFPFAILTKPDMVRLVAGEELRYTLRSHSLETWLPGLLKNFGREVEWRPLLNELPKERHQQALEIVTRLYGERVLLRGNGKEVPIAEPLRWVVEGKAKLGEKLRAAVPAVSSSTLQELSGRNSETASSPQPSPPVEEREKTRSVHASNEPSLGAEARSIAVLCQDNLDYASALDFNRRCRESHAARWLWVSCGAMSRGFVSPIFRPDAGPCLECLIRNFQRLSPTPEIYEHLIEHSKSNGEIPPVPFPDPALDLLIALARWKIESCSKAEPPPGVYRLHVLEANMMECTAHRVFRDPHCPDCSG